MKSNRIIRWWRRPCGVRDVLVLALPLVVSTMSWTVMNFIDRMFLLWYSTASMAAAMPAGMLHFTMLCFPFGVALYVNTFVAQYHGAGRPERIGPVVWQGIWIGVLAAPVFLLSIPLAPLAFRLAGHVPEVAHQETLYFQALAFAGGAVVIAAAMSSFFTGRGAVRVVMAVDTAAAAVNVVLDYAWIFGHGGFPEMGIAGAAWATVVAEWFRVAAYGYIMRRPRYGKNFGLSEGWRWDFSLMRRLWRYGGPNGLQMLIEVAAFAVFTLLVGRLGEDAMAATTLAMNVNSVAWVPILGVGIAVSTIVGQQLGAARPRLAERATWTALWIAMLYMGIMAALYVLVPGLFLLGHAVGTDPQRFSTLRDTTVVLLRFVAAYCLFDALNLVFASALKGAGDTRFILWTSLLVSLSPVLLVGWGTTYAGMGLLWCWIALTGWVCALGVVYCARFLQGRWRQMRVIERAPTDDAPSDRPALDLDYT